MRDSGALMGRIMLRPRVDQAIEPLNGQLELSRIGDKGHLQSIDFYQGFISVILLMQPIATWGKISYTIIISYQLECPPKKVGNLLGAIQ
jgi:hypothetical protein